MTTPEFVASRSEVPVALIKEPTIIESNGKEFIPTDKTSIVQIRKDAPQTLKEKVTMKSNSSEGQSVKGKKELNFLLVFIWLVALIVAFFTNPVYAIIFGGLGLIFFGVRAAKKGKKEKSVNQQEASADLPKKKSGKKAFAIIAIVLGIALLSILLIGLLAFGDG